MTDKEKKEWMIKLLESPWGLTVGQRQELVQMLRADQENIELLTDILESSTDNLEIVEANYTSALERIRELENKLKNIREGG